MRIINIAALLCCLIIGNEGWAQPAYKATLPTVRADAFYAIDLPHEVLGGARTDLADIRIKDSKGQEVAWLLQEDVRSGHDSEFIPYQTTITSTSRRTHVLITANGDSISSFTLKIKNADIEKESTLAGSNDGKKWFAVKDYFRLSNISSSNRTEALLDLSFPLSDYKFYKIEISDSLSAPLNIVGVGKMKDELYYEQGLLEVPLHASSIRQKGKRTEIQLIYPCKYQIERIAFYISSPQYFCRELKMVSPWDAPISTLSHRRTKPQSAPMEVYTDTLRMSVFNGDDQPLTIDSIKTYIRKFYLVAALKQGMSYTFTYGDENASSPQYDLSFRHQLPTYIEHLTVENIKQIPQTVNAQQSEVPSPWIVFLKKYGIWIIIAVVIIQILFMVKKLMK